MAAPAGAFQRRAGARAADGGVVAGIHDGFVDGLEVGAAFAFRAPVHVVTAWRHAVTGTVGNPAPDGHGTSWHCPQVTSPRLVVLTPGWPHAVNDMRRTSSRCMTAGWGGCPPRAPMAR